jgi:hypothetical protein
VLAGQEVLLEKIRSADAEGVGSGRRASGDRLERLARNTQGSLSILAAFAEGGAGFKSLPIPGPLRLHTTSG